MDVIGIEGICSRIIIRYESLRWIVIVDDNGCIEWRVKIQSNIIWNDRRFEAIDVF